MNKIVFLLFASLVCANAALLTDTSDNETALLSQYNAAQLKIKLQVSMLVSDIKKMSSDSDYVTTADADALSKVRTLLVDGGAKIAEGTETKEEVAAKITAIFDDVEPKMVAHWNKAAENTDTTSDDVKIEVGQHWTDSKTAAGISTGTAEKVTGTFDSMRITIDELLSVAVEINSEINSQVYTQLNNSLTEVNRILEVIVDTITELSADSDNLTTADAESLTTTITEFFDTVSAILGGNGETGTEVAAKIKTVFRDLKRKFSTHYSMASEKYKVNATDTILAITAVDDLFTSMKSQIDAILAFAPKIAAMKSA